MMRATGATLVRIVRGETALHRRVRRETLLTLTIISAVTIYRLL